MSKSVKIVGGVVVIAVLAVAAYVVFVPGPMAFAGGNPVPLAQYSGQPTGVPADFPAADAVARGRYLAQAADCEACHTAEGGKPFAGGRPFVTVFGTIYSPNITPDAETGIGSWSDADFVRALHRGIDKDGRHLYPAFPYAAFTYLTDQDAQAIKAYIFSLPAVHNTAPANTLVFPFNQRGLMALWSLFYNPDKRFEPRPDRSAAWNRGAYLAEALAHCGECHTPRTPLQALNNRDKFGGGYAEGWRAYNLSSDKDAGIGGWSAAELQHYLQIGHTMNRGSAFGPMAQAVHLSLQNLVPSDVQAIVEYVRSVPAVSSSDLPAPKLALAPANPTVHIAADAADPHGHDIFARVCVGCHGWSGENDYVPYTTLTGARAINDPTATNVALALLRGASPLPSAGAVAQMPSFASWSDDQIAELSNYVTARFGATPSAITPEEVHKLRMAD
ncbi:MAG TPA: cytochrome c [Steroidobacteraceae bacterium]|nr:cytochrome c [Steroidobacteraceae bacterium]